MSTIEANLSKAQINIPAPAPPAANYLPYRVHNHTVYVSGQLPMFEGQLKFVGKVGLDFSLEEAQEAAHLCALNILAQVKAACQGDLDRVESCVRLGGFVNCLDTFTDQPKVINAASDLMITTFGERGFHSRAAVGVNALPLGVAVEIDAVFALKA